MIVYVVKAAGNFLSPPLAAQLIVLSASCHLQRHPIFNLRDMKLTNLSPSLPSNYNTDIMTLSHN